MWQWKMLAGRQAAHKHKSELLKIVPGERMKAVSNGELPAFAALMVL